MTVRADQSLIDQGHFDNLEEARKAIMAGWIRIGSDHVIRNASELVDENAQLQVNRPSPYVSRGADKLIKALRSYAPDLKGKVGLDIGASTGGFTDLMLQEGARKVYAVDSGHGQLHLKLREDPRVINLEKTNAKYLTDKEIAEKADIMTCDVSFISCMQVLPPCQAFLKDEALIFCLIKPQFEAEARLVEKGGVVRDPAVHDAVCRKVCNFAEESLDWQTLACDPAPVKGPKGNQEFVAIFKKLEK